MTDEIKVHSWPPSHGGQHTKPTTGVLALHVRTGLAVVCTSESSRAANQERAAERLRAWVDSYDRAEAGARLTDAILASLAAHPSPVEDVEISQEMVDALSEAYNDDD